MRLSLLTVLISSFLLSRAQPPPGVPGVDPKFTQVVEKRLTSADGTAVYSQGTGNTEGRAIIFLHGFAWTYTSFNLMFTNKKLLETYHMIRYDARGHGQSGKPTTPEYYATERYADDMKAMLDGWKLCKPYFLGWALGSPIGVDIATNFPHPLPFSGMITFGAVPYMGPVWPKSTLPFIPGMQSFDSATGFDARELFVTILSSFTPASPELPQSIIENWAGSTAWFPPACAVQVVNRTQDPTLFYKAGGEGWPLLMIAGSKDHQLNGTYMIDFLAPHFTNLVGHIVPGGGHTVFYDNETIVSDLIYNWVEGIEKDKPYPVSETQWC